MTEHDFIKQLKGLKQITPDQTWLKSNREILLSQIANSGAQEISSWKRILIDVRSFTQAISQPALVLGSLLLFATGASAFGYLAFNRAKPDESLYIARIISEKAKLASVFNNEEKAKLEVQFAADHAAAITQVLAEAEEGKHDDAQVAQLNESFNKEIDTVRTRIAGIKKSAVATPAPVATTSDEEMIVTAGNEKDDKGLSLAVNNGTANPQAATTTATSTKPAETKPEVRQPDAILEEAKVLFDNKEYDGALDKLKEVKEIINNNK
ncbi:MAG: hypothetical protein ACM3PZ_03225 [Bacillota bacterium]